MTKEEVSDFIISSFKTEGEQVETVIDLRRRPLAKKRAVDIPVSNVTVSGPGREIVLGRIARS